MITMCIITLLFIALAVVILAGKGDWLIAGYNTASQQEKQQVNIKRLRLARGLTVRQVQTFFGFEEPQAIYKWQRGESLPTVDNLYALGALLEVPMEHILVPMKSSLHIVNEQQDKTCCFCFEKIK